MKNKDFPKDFYWGCSTSAHQIEGGLVNDWSEWEKSEMRIAELKEKQKEPADFISGQACESYIRENADINCLTQLGVNAYRFSIDWSRIEPEEGKFNIKEIEKYNNFILKLREHDIEPFLTLWHWPVPLWVRDIGGWKSKKTIKYFERFVIEVEKVIGDDIKYWVTLNEPLVYSANSYKIGEWPPQEKSLISTVRVVRNLAKAHKEVYKVLKKANQNYQVGIASHNIHFDPKPKNFINSILASNANYFWNDWFLKKTKNEQDFIGLNYYFRSSINFRFGENENKIVSDLGWELYPEGVYHVLKGLKKYNKPVYITEHGLADKDDKHRAWYLKESLKYAKQAMNEGVDLKGYFHWSLLDNFEWAEGFVPRFGLFEVDFDTCERKPRPSVGVYKKIIESNGKNI